MFSAFSRKEYVLLVFICLVLCALISFLYGKFIKKQERFSPVSLYLFLNAAVLHTFYIIYTRTWERQHDVIGFNNGKGIGQAALIEYLMEKGMLPDFDPTTRWGFFQPLLHHIISAVFLKINLMTGMNYMKACENIQILTLIYSLIFIIYGFRILKMMGLKGAGLYVSEAVTALHPLLTLLSGSVNNDMLSHMFLIMAVYYALKWYLEDKDADLFLTALTIGLSMMAKLSGVLAAPAIAFLMLSTLITDIREKKDVVKRIIKYVFFGVIALPLGLFFPLRNMILFHVPVTYMPEVGEALTDHGIISRILDIRTASPYAYMIKNGNPYDEYNIFLGLIKTSLTGEYDLGVANGYITFFAWILFISGVLLFVTDIILFFRIFFGDDGIKNVRIRLFWVILILTGILFMLRLIFTVPNFSSEDMRYIAWIIVPAAMIPGVYISGKNGGICRNIIIAEAAVFSVASAAVYYILGMP